MWSYFFLCVSFYLSVHIYLFGFISYSSPNFFFSSSLASQLFPSFFWLWSQPFSFSATTKIFRFIYFFSNSHLAWTHREFVVYLSLTHKTVQSHSTNVHAHTFAVGMRLALYIHKHKVFFFSFFLQIVGWLYGSQHIGPACVLLHRIKYIKRTNGSLAQTWETTI